jgi:hypothetical protein
MILVFHEDDPASDPRRNQVVELKSKQVVAEIPGDDPSYNRTLNHHDMGIASWSKDSSLLLWDVEGKWSPDLLSLVNLEGGKARWKLDVLKTAQREILRRTREAKPERYAAAKKENVGWGSAYPEGFNVDVVASVGEGDPVSLPLAFKVDLSANPKGVEDYPTNLDSYMDMIVKEDGTFFVKSFKLGKRPGGNGR